MFGETPESPLRRAWHGGIGPALASVAMFVLEIVQIVIISAAIIIPIRYFLIQPFYVKGASMEPNFEDHEYLIIAEISYRLRQPERGEIVVFRYPRDPSQFFIKRIVGLPGETVIVDDGHVSVASCETCTPAVLDEEYLIDPYTAGKKKITLEDDQYFVLGDNRGASLDSRAFGPVRRSSVVGRVWLRGYPFSKAGVFETPEYNF